MNVFSKLCIVLPIYPVIGVCRVKDELIIEGEGEVQEKAFNFLNLKINVSACDHPSTTFFFDQLSQENYLNFKLKYDNDVCLLTFNRCLIKTQNIISRYMNYTNADSLVNRINSQSICYDLRIQLKTIVMIIS